MKLKEAYKLRRELRICRLTRALAQPELAAAEQMVNEVIGRDIERVLNAAQRRHDGKH